MTDKDKIPQGKVIKDAIGKYMDRRFVSSIDMIGHGNVTLTVDRLESLDELEYADGKRKKKVVLMYFKETEKPLELNATNYRDITVMLESGDGKDWEGAKITFHVVKVKAFGEMKPAVRVVDAVRVAGAE